MLAEAKHEMLASLRLDPEQRDAGNRLTCDLKRAPSDCREWLFRTWGNFLAQTDTSRFPYGLYPPVSILSN